MKRPGILLAITLMVLVSGDAYAPPGGTSAVRSHGARLDDTTGMPPAHEGTRKTKGPSRPFTPPPKMRPSAALSFPPGAFRSVPSLREPGLLVLTGTPVGEYAASVLDLGFGQLASALGAPSEWAGVQPSDPKGHHAAEIAHPTVAGRRRAVPLLRNGNDPLILNYLQARQYCEERLGGGWRLPSADEIDEISRHSIVRGEEPRGLNTVYDINFRAKLWTSDVVPSRPSSRYVYEMSSRGDSRGAGWYEMPVTSDAGVMCVCAPANGEGDCPAVQGATLGTLLF